MTIWCNRITCRIPKATNTHTEFVIIIEFPLQQWSHERTSILRHTYTPVFFFPPFLCFLHCLFFLFRKITISSVTRILCSAIHLTLFNVTHFGFLNKAFIRQTNQSKKPHSVCFFVLFSVALRPKAGHSLLIFEVSRSHTTTHHSRQDSSGRVISSS